jgi:hypothetical protein
MGVVLAFAVGYVVGARAGQQGYDDVVDAIRAVRESEEFAGLVAALRSHGSAMLRQLSDLLGGEVELEPDLSNLRDRVRELVERARLTSPSS